MSETKTRMLHTHDTRRTGAVCQTDFCWQTRKPAGMGYYAHPGIAPILIDGYRRT